MRTIDVLRCAILHGRQYLVGTRETVPVPGSGLSRISRRTWCGTCGRHLPNTVRRLRWVQEGGVWSRG